MDNVVPFLAPERALPAEGMAVLSLLSSIANPELRRYCIDQLGAAETSLEVAAAIALARALGGGDAAARDAGRRVPSTAPPSDLGQGPAARWR